MNDQSKRLFFYYYLYVFTKSSYLHTMHIRLGCNIALIVFLVLLVEVLDSFILQMLNWLVMFLVSLDLYWKKR